MFTEKELAESEAIESTTVATAQSQAKSVRADVDLIPNLYGANVVADTLALNDSYLTLEQGEMVRGVLIDIEHRVIEGEFMQFDKNTGLPIPVEVVSLLIQTPEGEMEQKNSASAMLVGILKDNLARNTIQKLKTPIQITYLGKGDTKKKTSYFKWDVRLLSFVAA
jgi:hypothetical protein